MYIYIYIYIRFSILVVGSSTSVELWAIHCAGCKASFGLSRRNTLPFDMRLREPTYPAAGAPAAAGGPLYRGPTTHALSSPPASSRPVSW
jgi:hypothetical protein